MLFGKYFINKLFGNEKENAMKIYGEDMKNFPKYEEVLKQHLMFATVSGQKKIDTHIHAYIHTYRQTDTHLH